MKQTWKWLGFNHAIMGRDKTGYTEDSKWHQKNFTLCALLTILTK